MPNHMHLAKSQTTFTEIDPTDAIWANAPSGRGKPNLYNPTPNVAMHSNAIQATGGSQPHNNRQPYVGLNYIIALTGVYPSRP